MVDIRKHIYMYATCDLWGDEICIPTYSPRRRRRQSVNSLRLYCTYVSHMYIRRVYAVGLLRSDGSRARMHLPNKHTHTLRETPLAPRHTANARAHFVIITCCRERRRRRRPSRRQCVDVASTATASAPAMTHFPQHAYNQRVCDSRYTRTRL